MIKFRRRSKPVDAQAVGASPGAPRGRAAGPHSMRDARGPTLGRGTDLSTGQTCTLNARLAILTYLNSVTTNYDCKTIFFNGIPKHFCRSE